MPLPEKLKSIFGGSPPEKPGFLIWIPFETRFLSNTIGALLLRSNIYA